MSVFFYDELRKRLNSSWSLARQSTRLSVAKLDEKQSRIELLRRDLNVRPTADAPDAGVVAEPPPYGAVAGFGRMQTPWPPLAAGAPL